MSHQQLAVAEYVRIVGSETPDQEWILSDLDSWHRNPFYSGPRGRHPEDDNYGDDQSGGDDQHLGPASIQELDCEAEWPF